MKKVRVVILPDLGSEFATSNWYSWLAERLRAEGIEVIAQTMPDAEVARKSSWLPFVEQELKLTKDTIVIGHAIGAAAALRLTERNHLFGLVLVSASHTDLGSPEKSASDYYSEAWRWEVINRNCNWVVLFASHDDDAAPISESRFIHEKLDCEYHEFTDRGHFGSEYREETEFPEIVQALKRKLFLV